MTDSPAVTIIIPNYNMEAFIGEAIESALAQDHPEVEVIVVDDGSTDDSLKVILRYEKRVRLVLCETNIGQVSALSRAWPLARNPIIMFLDADDMLMPNAASTVAAIFRPEAAKVQFCSSSIDGEGRPLDHVAPKYPAFVNTDIIRNAILESGTAPASPGSANAYPRWLLFKVRDDGGFTNLPHRNFPMDSILEINAPFYGEVITLRMVLVQYRMHEAQISSTTNISASRFKNKLRNFGWKLSYLESRCQYWGRPFNARVARDRALWALEYRLAAAKLIAVDDSPGENSREILRLAVRACIKSPFSRGQKVARGLWITLVALSPRMVASRLIETRFVIARRPRWLERFLWLRPPTCRVRVDKR